MKDFAAMRSKGYNYLTATTIKKKSKRHKKKKSVPWKEKLNLKILKVV